MLVLSRKQNEKIRIGADIVINIISLSDKQVKIGIEAPKDVKILREELYENLRQNTIEAAQHTNLAGADDLENLKKSKFNIRTDDAAQ